MRHHTSVARSVVGLTAASFVATACLQSQPSEIADPIIAVTTTDIEPFEYTTESGETENDPSLDPDDLVAFAERADLTTVVALDNNTVHATFVGDSPDPTTGVNAGRESATHDVAPLGWAWSDGVYVYQWVDVGDGTLESTVATLDGTVVCEGDGSVHHFTPGDPESGEPDVMSVEASPADWNLPSDGPEVNGEEADEDDGVVGAEFAIPLFDVDCDTGDSTAGESVSFRGTDGFRFIKTSGPRTFTGIRGADGITDLANSVGSVINGDDAAIDHSFNAAATLVAYGLFESDDDPSIVTDVIRMRAVGSGDILWTVELPFPFTSLDFAGDRLVVGQPDNGGPQGGRSTSSILIFDVRDATVLGHFAAPFEVLSVGG